MLAPSTFLPISAEGDSFSGEVWGLSQTLLCPSQSHVIGNPTFKPCPESPWLTIPGPDHQPLTWSSCFCFSYILFIPDAWRSLTKAPHGTSHCKPDMFPCCHQGKNQILNYTSKLSCVTSSPVWPHLPMPHPHMTHWLPCSPSFTKAAPHWGISMWCSLSPTEAAELILSPPPPSPSIITFSVKSAALTTAFDTASLSLPPHIYTHSYHRYTPPHTPP